MIAAQQFLQIIGQGQSLAVGSRDRAQDALVPFSGQAPRCLGAVLNRSGGRFQQSFA